MRVLVTHPGLQHAHQLAWALEDAGYLAAFWSGMPVRDSRYSVAWAFIAFRNSFRAIPVSSFKRRHAIYFPLLQRALNFLLQPRLASDLSHRLEHLYDFWMARRVGALKPDLVVCYENAALQTFRAAKLIGAICVLDASSIHYAAQRLWLEPLGAANPNWVDRQKQQEIELADIIITCSDMAASTYAAAGVAANKLMAIPLGTQLSDLPTCVKNPSSLLRFVFVGAIRFVKGIDLLLDIFSEFQNSAVPAQLTIIGSSADINLSKRAKLLKNVSLMPFISHPALFEEMSKHDVLVLPSRFDSFGMVVPEAMSVGLPVLVTDQVGAKCIIEGHPDAGWIVTCDLAAIREKILFLVENRNQVVIASKAAKFAAQDYQWHSYRKRAVAALVGVYDADAVTD